MTNIIEVKDTITDAVAAFPDVLNTLGDIETKMTSAENMLVQNLWTGDAREKCDQIHGLLGEYHSSIRELVTRLQAAVTALEGNKTSFPSNSEALVIINSI